jgi:hypothetical protein
MSSVFEWKTEPMLLEKVLNLAQQQKRSPDEIITEAVVLYLQNKSLAFGNHQEPGAISLDERRAFMKLPLEERRRILQEQAEAMAIHYQQDTEWRDLQPGDLIEY